MTAPEVSHGRGGAGNITHDDTKYVDGSIVRQGEIGTHGDGAYSTGRGGAANIADKHAPQAAARADQDYVPPEATRPSLEGDFHTGRGGAANVVHVPPGSSSAKSSVHNNDATATTTAKEETAPAAHAKNPNIGLADKLKKKIFGAFKK
ncbi:hypothetical protein F5Y17DRAFT_177055 [Xylariaceae sp. FL0594]|nr:hypothetical protein F5Y17DRAFT_177055 [Xylariaceae sp. FL0594]